VVQAQQRFRTTLQCDGMAWLNYYMLSKEFSEIMTLYAVDIMKLSCAGIQDAVSVC